MGWTRTWKDALVPDAIREYARTRRLSNEIDRLQRQCELCPSIAEKAGVVLASERIRSCQKPGEIIPLLEQMQQLQPRRLMEIGARGGGTLLLLCQVAHPTAQILSLDIAYSSSQQRAYTRMARGRQNVTCRRGDSHTDETLAFVRAWLGDSPLDCLLIDGDHTFDGVRRDFQMYGPLLRPGGLVALHDIHPDFRTQRGTPTTADTGQVPQFWADLKRRHVNTTELIEHAEQDGYGIGIMTWRSAA